MGEFITSSEFMEGIIQLAIQCFGVGATGCTFRTPEIDGDFLEVDIHFKMHKEEKK